jgi:hypothetical protein
MPDQCKHLVNGRRCGLSSGHPGDHVPELGGAVVPLGEAPPVTGALTVNPATAFLAEANGVAEAPKKVPIISINHRENQFLLPTGELSETVSGYLVYYFRTRKYYKKSPKQGEKGAPPDCWSADLVRPHATSLEQQSELCADCTMNQFGTARDGRSKACGEPLWLFLYNQAFGEIPVGVVTASTASLRPILGTRFEAGYLAQAKARHGAYQIVWTTFRLKSMGGDQVQYSVLDPQMGPALKDPAQMKALAAFHNQFKDAMDSMRLKGGEAPKEEETDA